MKCTTHELGFLQKYKYVVTFARYNGQWIFCRHKKRTTWEASGGHIEPGEIPIEAARRELYEETGALEFDIEPVCDYWASDEPGEAPYSEWANGVVFLAKVHVLGALPDNEMAGIGLFDQPPVNLTYPDIMAVIFPCALRKLQNESTEMHADLKLSELMAMQKQLQEKHKGEWTPLTPDCGR